MDVKINELQESRAAKVCPELKSQAKSHGKTFYEENQTVQRDHNHNHLQ
jgi:hypothetical protein